MGLIPRGPTCHWKNATTHPLLHLSSSPPHTTPLSAAQTLTPLPSPSLHWIAAATYGGRSRRDLPFPPTSSRSSSLSWMTTCSRRSRPRACSSSPRSPPADRRESHGIPGAASLRLRPLRLRRRPRHLLHSDHDAAGGSRTCERDGGQILDGEDTQRSPPAKSGPSPPAAESFYWRFASHGHDL